MKKIGKKIVQTLKAVAVALAVNVFSKLASACGSIEKIETLQSQLSGAFEAKRLVISGIEQSLREAGIAITPKMDKAAKAEVVAAFNGFASRSYELAREQKGSSKEANEKLVKQLKNLYQNTLKPHLGIEKNPALAHNTAGAGATAKAKAARAAKAVSEAVIAAKVAKATEGCVTVDVSKKFSVTASQQAADSVAFLRNKFKGNKDKESLIRETVRCMVSIVLGNDKSAK
jgi:hypothetical protein